MNAIIRTLKLNRVMLLSIGIGALTLFAFILLGLNVLWQTVGATGGIGGLAVIIGASYVFNAFTSLIIGYIVDKFQKKRTIVVSLFACAALTFLWIFAGYSLLVAVVVYIAIDIVSDIYADAFTALVAEKLSSSQYVKLSAIELITNNVVSIGSSLVSALFIMFMSQEMIIVIVASILALSALICIKFLPQSKVARQMRIDAETKKTANLKKTLKGKLASAWQFAKVNVLTDKKIMLYTVILFFLNLDYAFIPTMLPFFLMTTTESTSLFLVVIMQSGNDIGEMLAAGILVKFGHLVSLLTKIGLVGSALTFAFLPFVYPWPVVATILFIVYGFFDTLTQPYYSYFVSSLDNKKRGRIIGIVNSIVLMASPLGILLGTMISAHGIIPLTVGIVSVFIIAAVVFSNSKAYGNVKLEPSADEDDEDDEDDDNRDEHTKDED